MRYITIYFILFVLFFRARTHTSTHKHISIRWNAKSIVTNEMYGSKKKIYSYVSAERVWEQRRERRIEKWMNIRRYKRGLSGAQSHTQVWGLSKILDISLRILCQSETERKWKKASSSSSREAFIFLFFSALWKGLVRFYLTNIHNSTPNTFLFHF